MLLLDRAGWHSAGNLAVPKNIGLMFPPPAGARAEPGGNVWQYPRANWLLNHVPDSCEAIIHVACDARNRLTKQPGTFTSSPCASGPTQVEHDDRWKSIVINAHHKVS